MLYAKNLVNNDNLGAKVVIKIVKFILLIKYLEIPTTNNLFFKFKLLEYFVTDHCKKAKCLFCPPKMENKVCAKLIVVNFFGYPV